MNPTIEIGDTVRILPRYVESARCQGQSLLTRESGHIGFVVDSVVSHGTRKLIVRYLPEDAYDASFVTLFPYCLRLIAKGDGSSEPFVLSPREVYLNRLYEHQAKLAACDVSHQGFSNAATFLAVLYLKNDAKALAEVIALQRKDGTVNPDKLNKLFYRNGFTIDAWAYESPIKTPEALEGVQFRLRNSIDWQEVANEFKREDTQ